MRKSVLRSSSQLPFLIVDRRDTLCNVLYERLTKEAIVVMVGGFPPKNRDDLIFIPYIKRIPKIPDTLYQAILFVWDGKKDELELLPEFLKKARNDVTPFLFITPYKLADKVLFDKILSQYNKSTIVVLGDLFGRDAVNYKQSSIDELLYHAKKTGTISLGDMGLGRVYPMYFPDVMDHLIGIMKNSTQQGLVINLFPQLPLTQLAIARIVQRFNPLIQVDFIKGKNRPPASDYHSNGEWPLGSVYPLHNRIEKAYQETIIPSQDRVVLSKDHKKWYIQTPEEQNDKLLPENPVAQMGLLFIAYCVFIFMLFPVAGTLLFGYWGQEALLAAKTNAEKGNLQQALTDASFARNFLMLAQGTGKFLYQESVFVGKKKEAVLLLEKIDTAKTLAEAIQYTFSSALTYKNVFAGKSKNPEKDFMDATNTFKNAIIDFQILRQSDSLPQEFYDKLKKLNSTIELLSNTIDAFPYLMGIDHEKKYLVLFQNNMELRPGGGFIGSYALVKVAGGQINDFAIRDVYDADGQLKGHIEPPFPIRRFMRIPHLYLRDSNFDIDFAKNAPVVANIFAQEMNEKVDGVIGVDLSFVKSLIAAIGEIKVPDYNETVTADNFFLKTEAHAEKNFFPGSTAKKDFLRSLMISLEDKLNHGNIPLMSLLEKSSKAIKEKHVIFAFGNQVIQNIFTVNSLSSSLWDAREANPDGINDFIGINEANIGVNKVNYFIDRSISHHVTISDTGDYLGELTTTYHNKSKKDEWPGGDYSNYMRVILPPDAVFQGVAINNIDQETTAAVTDFHRYEDPGFSAPHGLEINGYNQSGKSIYGFLVTIPAESTYTIKVKYRLSQKLDTGKPLLRYNVRVFKQPGTEGDPFSFQLSYPGNYRVINASQGFSGDKGTMYYLNYLTTDQYLQVDFAKQ